MQLTKKEQVMITDIIIESAHALDSDYPGNMKAYNTLLAYGYFFEGSTKTILSFGNKEFKDDLKRVVYRPDLEEDFEKSEVEAEEPKEAIEEFIETFNDDVEITTENPLLNLLSNQAKIKHSGNSSISGILNEKFTNEQDIKVIDLVKETIEKYAVENIMSTQIGSTTDASRFLDLYYKDKKQEELTVIFLNTKNQVIKFETIFVGSINQCISHPREVFGRAVELRSARIILAHNHPSGDPEPSPADNEMTKRMVECGQILGVEVLDHFIIGRSDYYSYACESYLIP